MKLMHFSNLPVLSVRSTPIDAQGRRRGDKPTGLWVSDEDTDWGWSHWCEAESVGRGDIPHMVELSPTANVLRIGSVPELDGFTDEWQDRSSKRNHRWRDSVYEINWAAVAEKYDGILITPYLYDRRLDDRTSWYYSWDCASGCIWNGSAVSKIEPVCTPAVVAAALEQATL